MIRTRSWPWLPALLLAAVLGALSASASAATAQELERFAWLQGTWEGMLDVGDGLAVAELQYLPPRGGVLPGSFRLTKDGRTLVLELFSLASSDSGVEMRIRHFDGDLSAWEEEPIVLALESASDTLYAFRNHQGDRPRWSYLQPLGPDRFRAWSHLYAEDGTRSEIELTYQRSDGGESAGGRTAVPVGALAPFAPLLGSWEAAGDGFRSVLTYRTGTTGRVVHAFNEVYGADGDEIARYEGAYVLDEVAGEVRFRTVSSGGELHEGRVETGEGFAHGATVSGGRIAGYRSRVDLTGPDTMEYRAVYRVDATDAEVRASFPLVYRRVSGPGGARLPL